MPSWRCCPGRRDRSQTRSSDAEKIRFDEADSAAGSASAAAYGLFCGSRKPLRVFCGSVRAISLPSAGTVSLSRAVPLAGWIVLPQGILREPLHPRIRFPPRLFLRPAAIPAGPEIFPLPGVSRPKIFPSPDLSRPEGFSSPDVSRPEGFPSPDVARRETSFSAAS